jgi:hypothetical protein
MARRFDHLVLCVRDLEQARKAYGALGFTLTPRADHPFGTCNSLVQLQASFLELLGVVDPSRFPPPAAGRFSFAQYNKDFLDKHEGLSMLVFASADALADAAEFQHAGLDSYQPFHFARKATLPDGTKADVSFSLAFVTNKAMPEAAFFTCQQHAPEHFWRAEYQRHANGAAQLVEVVMSAATPAEFRSYFERLMNAPSSATPGRLSVGGTGQCLTVMDHKELAARFPEVAKRGPKDTPRFEAYAIQVPDLVLAKRRLVAAGVPFRSTDRSIVVPPSHAFGVAIEFTAAG